MFSSMDRLGPGRPCGAAGTARWTSGELIVVYAVERSGWSRTACEWRQTTAYPDICDMRPRRCFAVHIFGNCQGDRPDGCNLPPHGGRLNVVNDSCV